MNEIRNQLLIIRNLKKAIEKNDDIDFQFSYLLERFQIELETKRKNLEYELKEVIENLETLNYVKSEVLKNEK